MKLSNISNNNINNLFNLLGSLFITYLTHNIFTEASLLVLAIALCCSFGSIHCLIKNKFGWAILFLLILVGLYCYIHSQEVIKKEEVPKNALVFDLAYNDNYDYIAEIDCNDENTPEYTNHLSCKSFRTGKTIIYPANGALDFIRNHKVSYSFFHLGKKGVKIYDKKNIRPSAQNI